MGASLDTDAPGDYTLDSSTEVTYLFANGVRLARLVHQPLDSAGDGKLLRVFFELGDHLGSTSVALDKDTGELVERSAYQAYGGAESSYRPSKWGDFREDYRFTGKEEDVEVGLTYFGKRFYNALLQRWVSPDPLEVHQPGQADANLYAYVSGAALKNVDPLGLADDEAPAPEFSIADEVQTNEAIDNAFDPCANDGCVKLDTAPSSPPPPRADARDAPKPGDDSICPGVCHDNPNLTSDEYRKALGGATAETFTGMTPVLGELLDAETLLDVDSSWADKGWAAAGIIVPGVGGKTLKRVLGSGGDELAEAIADAPTPVGATPPIDGVRGRFSPLEEAEGPHTVYRRDQGTGKISHYQTWDAQTNPRNPHPYQPGVRYDGQGPGHFNRATGEQIETPHIHDEAAPGGVRRATPSEIPGGG